MTFTITITTVKTALQYEFDSKRPYWVCFRLRGTSAFPQGLLGSSLTLSSDPIIQLAVVVARLEGDDGRNTCGGCVWCGPHRSWIPDQLVPFLSSNSIQQEKKKLCSEPFGETLSGPSMFSTEYCPLQLNTPTLALMISLNSKTEDSAKHITC